MHACGGYRYNSLEYILHHEPIVSDQPQLYLVHRLDRVTSGLVILAKSKNEASNISNLIQSKAATKVYLARVKGRFPANIAALRALDAINWQRFDSSGEDASSMEKSSKKRPLEETESAQDTELKPGYIRNALSFETIGTTPVTAVVIWVFNVLSISIFSGGRVHQSCGAGGCYGWVCL